MAPIHNYSDPWQGTLRTHGISNANTRDGKRSPESLRRARKSAQRMQRRST